jgi:hypothetical protein
VRQLGVRLYRMKPKALGDYAELAKEIMEICHEETIA